MKKKAPLVIGILCGLVCAGCVFAYTLQLEQQASSARAEAMARYGGEQVEVMVATRDIYPGESLNSSNTTTRTWVSDLLPDDCVTDLKEVQGTQLSSLVIEGEAISLKRFETESVELEVPEGCVALSVPAKDVQAVGGSLSAGSKVNVYATGSQTNCLGTNVLVLATNASSTESENASVSWVTLAVPEDQSQDYVAASQSMEIYFTLPAEDVADDASVTEGEEQ